MLILNLVSIQVFKNTSICLQIIHMSHQMYTTNLTPFGICHNLLLGKKIHFSLRKLSRKSVVFFNLHPLQAVLNSSVYNLSVCFCTLGIFLYVLSCKYVIMCNLIGIWDVKFEKISGSCIFEQPFKALHYGTHILVLV